MRRIECCNGISLTGEKFCCKRDGQTFTISPANKDCGDALGKATKLDIELFEELKALRSTSHCPISVE